MRNKVFPIISLLFLIFTPCVGFADSSIQSKAQLPDEMKALGFAWDTDSEKPQLLVPSPKLWSFASSLPDSMGSSEGADFTDFKYERKGQKVEIVLKTNNGQKGVYNIDLDTLKMTLREYFHEKLVEEQSDYFVGDNALARAIAEFRSTSTAKELDYVLSKYDSHSKVLTITEKARGIVKRSIKLDIPEGVKLSILDGRFLLMQDLTGKHFKASAPFAGSAEGSRVLLDLANYLHKDSETCSYASWGIYSPGTLQTSTLESIQAIVNRLAQSRQ